MDPLFPLAALAIGAAVGLLARFGRDPKDDEHGPSDEHDLSDYMATVENALEAIDAAEERGWHRGFDTARRYPRPVAKADDILPPAPPGMNAGSPLYAETLFRQWFPESPADTAARFLREIRDEALAGVAK